MTKFLHHDDATANDDDARVITILRRFLENSQAKMGLLHLGEDEKHVRRRHRLMASGLGRECVNDIVNTK